MLRFINKWGNSAVLLRNKREDPVLKAAMGRVEACLRVIHDDWNSLSARERKTKYPDMRQITGGRRELILSDPRRRERCVLTLNKGLASVSDR